MTTNADGSPTTTAPATTTPVTAPAAPLTLDDGAPTAPTVPIVPAAPPSAPTAIDYAPTGDAGLDMTLSFLGGLNIDPADPAMVAAGEGNFSLLEAKLGAMGDKAKGWEKFLALGKQSYEGVKGKAEAKAAAERTIVETAVGGAENWTVIQDWARKNAEPAEKEAVNAALNAGGIAAKAMALYLAGLYERSSGAVIKGKSATVPGAGSGSPNSVALAPRAFVAEVEKLRQKLGSRMDESPEYKQLQQRRHAWRG